MNRMIEFVIPAVLILILLVAGMKYEFKPSGKVTELPVSITIIVEANGIMFEDEGNAEENDNIFQIGPVSLDDGWYSYNGTYGGVDEGYDTNINGNNITETFSFKNKGSTSVDVLIAAEDFGDLTSYIDVAEDDGNLQIYIPGVGWKNIPDGSDTDADSHKDDRELCIINDLGVDQSVTGFDFRVRTNAGLISKNYTGKIMLTTYDDITINVCFSQGFYVTP